MQSFFRSTLAGYALAPLLVGLAIGLKMLFDPFLGRGAPFLLTFAAIMLSAWYGRFGAGLVATVLCALGIYFFFLPPYYAISFAFENLIRIGLFLVEGLVICWLTEALHKSRERTEGLARVQRESLTREQGAMTALQAVRQSEQELTRIVDHLPDIIYRLDGNLRHRYVSPAVVQHFGVATAAFLGKTLVEAGLPPSVTDPTDLACNELLKTREPQRLEFSFSGPRGRREYEGRIIPEFDAQGRVSSLLGITTDVTEQKKSASEILRFKTMSDSANDVCFCADAEDARLSYFNRRAIDDLGFSHEELQGMSLRDLYDVFDEEGFRGWVKDLTDKKTLGPVEAMFRRKDGSSYPVELSLTLQELDGRPHLCGVARNISERKQAEENLRLSRERLDLVVQSTGLGLWYCDLPFNRLIWNDRCREHYGVSPDAEITLDTFFERLHPDDREHTRQAIERSIQTGAPYDIDHRTIAVDGRQKWVRAIGRCFVDAVGEPRRFDGVTVDTTERKQTELRLRESERRYAALAELAPLLVWTADPAGNVDYFNQRWHDYTGQPFAALQGWNWTDVLHPDDRESTLQAWREALNRGAAIETEYRLRDRAGAYQWFLVRGFPLRDEDRIVKWFGACTNIDRQKLAEEGLKVADRRKDEFLAMLSHELRNPLAAIRNAMHLFDVQQLGDPTLVEARAVLDRQTQILAGLVDDLLDVFRIRHKKIMLRLETLDLAHLMRLTLGDLQSAFDGIGLGIVAEIPDRPMWVRGDRIRLSQVLMNLLNNAAKFTNPGGRISVRLSAEPTPGQAVVQVRDTGIGIAPDMLPHVFDTFCQANPGLARSRGGLGLGLALVKGLIELHDGKVSAASAGLGHGAEFAFWLPLVPAPAADPPPAREIATGRSLRVLIIEDNRDTARTLGLLLRRYGHQVEMAHSGTDGVAKANSWKPEIVLCDLGLPEIDGYEVARRLRSDPLQAGTRLIAVSGYGQEEDRRRSEQAGFDLHLTKPVDPVELQRLLTVLKVGT